METTYSIKKHKTATLSLRKHIDKIIKTTVEKMNPMDEARIVIKIKMK